MFEVWIFLMGAITAADAFLLTGITASIRTYSEHFPWFIPNGNSSLQNTMVAPSGFDIDKGKPTTLKEYLQELPTDHTNNHHNYSSGTWGDSKVVVVARISDNDSETGEEWTIVPEPKKRSETLSNSSKNGSKHSTESSDYFLGNDDIKKYLNDYQDLLYTFKDFVKIGADPSIRKNISQYNFSNENGEKVFNVTYVMPIPKTKKYFEIKLSNLTKNQYNEINALLQKHILRKTNSTEISKSKEQEIVYVDVNTMVNNLTGDSLTDPVSSHSQTSKPTSQKSRSTKDLRTENEPMPDFFGPLLTPEGFNYFLNNFDSIHINLNNNSVDQTIFQPSNSPPTLIQNNGFHAEIATDYDVNGENNAQDDLFNQTNNNSKGLSGSNYKHVGSGRSILNSHPRRNRTKLFSQTRSKRPIVKAPENVLNTRKIKILPTSVSTSEQPITTVSFTLPPNPSYNTSKLNFDSVNFSSNPLTDKPPETTSLKISQNTYKDRMVPDKNSSTSTSAQDWLEIEQLFNSFSTKPTTPSTVLDHNNTNITNELYMKTTNKQPFYGMEVVKLLTHMKRKIEEDERKKTEQYKSYIKQFLGIDEGSILLGRGNSGNVMKINQQENILEKLKWLMLGYFVSLNLNTKEDLRNSNSSAVQIILNTTNIFELMEQSSKLVNLSLHMKLEANNQEPKFLQRIAEKQVEKCKKIFNRVVFRGAKQKSADSTKKSGHRQFLVFTKCVNLKLQKCINGFRFWLEKGKFFLRPQFKLARAYENYEIERNLYCLRNYNPSSLDSSPHGVRVKPGPKINRKSGQRKTVARQSKARVDMKENRDRKYKKQRTSKQRPNVLRYSNQ